MSQWAWVVQGDDDFSPACADGSHECHEEDCVCACHIDETLNDDLWEMTRRER